MTTRSQKLKLGVFLALSTALGASLLLLFTGTSLFQSTDRYFVRVPGSVSGVEVGSPVAVRGVPVGSVEAVELYADDFESVRLKLEVEQGTRINKDAQATLAFKGVTGLKLVEIDGGTGESGALQPGSYIEYEPSALERVTDEAEKLVADVSELLKSSNQFVEQMASLSQTIDAKRIDSMMATVERTVERFDETGADVQQMVAQTKAPLLSSLESAERAFTGAGTATRDARLVLDNLNDTVLELKGVVRQNQGHVQAIAYNLREATESFKYLAQELRRRPSRLLIGGAPEERELP